MLTATAEMVPFPNEDTPLFPLSGCPARSCHYIFFSLFLVFAMLRYLSMALPFFSWALPTSAFEIFAHFSAIDCSVDSSIVSGAQVPGLH